MNTQPIVRFKAVKTYIESGESLRKTSEKLGLPHMTLWRWVNWYSEGGKGNLKRKRPYRRPWNRPSKEVEEKVMLLKEREPALTLKKAQEILAIEGIIMSLKGIWGIWKRYGVTGRKKLEPYALWGPLTPEAKVALEKTKTLVNNGSLKQASKIINSLPSFPKDPIIKEIPEEFLTPRRQYDRLFFFSGEVPFIKFYKKLYTIRKRMEKKKLLYSSLYAGIMESIVLDRLGDTEKKIELINAIERKSRGLRDVVPRFHIAQHKGKINSQLLQFKEAKDCLQQCKKLLPSLPYVFFYDSMGSILTNFGDYKNAAKYWQKALLITTDENVQRALHLRLALCNIGSGKYGEGIKFLRYAEREDEWSHSLFSLLKAYIAFSQGKISKTSSFLTNVLEESKAGQLLHLLHSSSLALAEIQAALGNQKEAKVILSKYLPLFRKYRMLNRVLMRDILLGKKLLSKEHLRASPIFYLLSLLQDGKYKKALHCARKNGQLGFFHRMVVFFPESVLAMLEKGKDTGLPRAILNLPVFRKEIPVYSVHFLGHLVVYKNQKYLRVKLSPKDTSFLIYLANSKGKSISLDKIYRNFWPKSKNPPRNLTHLLVRIRKSLKLPSHFLYIKEGRLFFDCYFTTDYGEYTEHLAQAKALLRAGEWGFAKREYLQAFKLFRGEPFKKMYDDWSDDKRLEILFSYESEVLSFAKELRARGRKEEAEKLLKKAERIVPFPPNNYQP